LILEALQEPQPRLCRIRSLADIVSRSEESFGLWRMSGTVKGEVE
jgi:hypothetical protein